MAGRYRIDGYLGRGGMGAVLSATHVVTGKRCAIKWVLPRASSGERQREERNTGRERLLREARMAGRIDHPNVVQIVDVGEHRTSIFLVMELLRGEPLKALIGRGPLPVDDAIRLLMPVMRGVAAAHEVGIVHRDLKPDNILLTRGDDPSAVRPTVLDFGISRGAEEGLPGDLTLTQTGVMVGTPLYMAPEQLAGAGDVDPRYDVYALGVILYELVCGGQRPFEGDTYALLVSSKLNGTLIPASRWRNDLDARFEKALLRAMARRPGSRFGSVQALATALEPFSEGCSFGDTDPFWRSTTRGVSEIDATHRTAPQASARRSFPWAVALAAVIASGIAAGVWWRSSDGQPARRAPVASSVRHDADAGTTPGAAIAEPPREASEVVVEGVEEGDGEPRRAGRGARGRTGRLRVSEF